MFFSLKNCHFRRSEITRDGGTDGRTRPLIEMLSRIWKLTLPDLSCNGQFLLWFMHVVQVKWPNVDQKIRLRISIRSHIRLSVGPSVDPSVRRSVRAALFSNDEKHHFLSSYFDEIHRGPRDSQGQFKKEIIMYKKKNGNYEKNDIDTLKQT